MDAIQAQVGLALNVRRVRRTLRTDTMLQTLQRFCCNPGRMLVLIDRVRAGCRLKGVRRRLTPQVEDDGDGAARVIGGVDLLYTPVQRVADEALALIHVPLRHHVLDCLYVHARAPLPVLSLDEDLVRG